MSFSIASITNLCFLNKLIELQNLKRELSKNFACKTVSAFEENLVKHSLIFFLVGIGQGFTSVSVGIYVTDYLMRKGYKAYVN